MGATWVYSAVACGVSPMATERVEGQTLSFQAKAEPHRLVRENTEAQDS